MELALDIFRTDDFRATEMTEMVGDINTVPTFFDDLGVFEPVYLRTTTVTLHSKNNNLGLVQSSPRGSPERLKGRGSGVIRQLEGPRIALRDRINAKEVENLLNPMLPTATRLASAMELVGERYAELKDDILNTQEYHRFACVTDGVILDADGTKITDFYDEFGIVPSADVAINISGLLENTIRAELDEKIGLPMRKVLKGRWRAGTTLHALCGDEAWKKLTSHAGVQRIWALQEEKVDLLGQTMVWKSITFAGVVWHHFAGSDDETMEIASDEIKVFPVGAKDVFKAYYLPGESFTELNAKAKPIYGVVSPDYRENMNEWVDVYCRSYPLFACLCPQALVTIKVT